jgi:hypothetical protein
MHARRCVLVAATAGLLALLGASGAHGDATTTGTLHGFLLGVGPGQRSLMVGWDDSRGPGCGVLSGSVTASASETSESVTVTVTAQGIVLSPGEACPSVLEVGRVNVALASPLHGRDVMGLTIQGQGFEPNLGEIVQTRLPNLVGLSPLDARLMMTSGVGTVGLVDRHTHRSRSGALAMVVGERPQPGTPIRRHMVVVLSVAP